MPTVFNQNQNRAINLRILLTTHQFLPDFSSGTEILAYETAKELQRLGHDVSVFTGYPAKDDIKDHDRFDIYCYDGIPVNRFAHGNVPMGDQSNFVEAEYNNIFFASFFRNYLNGFQPDLVHFFHLQRLSASAIGVCHELDVPMVMTPTDFWLVCPMVKLMLPDNSLCAGPGKDRVNCLRHFVALTQPPTIVFMFDKLPNWVVSRMIWGINKGMFANAWFAPLVRALYDRPAFLRQQMNRMDRMIVPTRMMGQTLIAHGLKEDKVFFCPFGINCDKAKKNGVPIEDSAKLRIGFIGTLAEHKGAHVLIEAVRELPHELCLDVQLYGKLDDFPEYVKKLKLSADEDPRIRFCGTFPNNEIGYIFAQLDVLVVPSIWYENTPLVIYSAQAAGCTVIVSNLPGMTEIVHQGENGLLFEAGNPSDLAQQIKSIIQKPEMLTKLSKNAKLPKTIAEYTTEIEAIYAEVLEERLKK